jgi:hypothetical protein
VTWSSGVKPEERVELTRRAPSHGSLSSESATSRGLVLFRLLSSGRSACGFVRVSGAEHTRRGGGRVWTDFLLAHPVDALRDGFHPQVLRAALAAEAPPKMPLGSTPLARITVVGGVASEPFARDARAVAMAAAVASLLIDGKPKVIAAGASALEVFEDALRMLPASLRGPVDGCAGLRYTTARGVKNTLTDRIDQDTIRATRGQGIECIDVETKPAAIVGPLAPWLSLMSRWWNEERGAEAVELADRLAGGKSLDEVLRVATIAEAVDRGQLSREALFDHLQRRTAA